MFAEEMKLKPIILGGDDAGKMAGFLEEKTVPVQCVTGILNLPLFGKTILRHTL